MKRVLPVFLILGLAVPGAAHAEDAKSPDIANCPAMMTGMEKELGEMMATVKDHPSQQQLARMHDRMGLMLANMQRMHGMMGNGGMGNGMMGGGMMRQGPGGKSPQDPAHDHPAGTH